MSEGSFKHNNNNNVTLWYSLGAFTDLLHEHVDVSLGCVQYVSVWVSQAPDCDFHCLSIDVDPAWSAAGQERPGLEKHMGNSLTRS